MEVQGVEVGLEHQGVGVGLEHQEVVVVLVEAVTQHEWWNIQLQS